MITKISKEFGTDKTVDEYIDLIARRKLASPEKVVAKAYEFCNKITDYYPHKPRSQQALAFLCLGYEDLGYAIPWKEIGKIAAQQNVRNLVRRMQKMLSSEWGTIVNNQIRNYRPQKSRW